MAPCPNPSAHGIGWPYLEFAAARPAKPRVDYIGWLPTRWLKADDRTPREPFPACVENLGRALGSVGRRDQRQEQRLRAASRRSFRWAFGGRRVSPGLIRWDTRSRQSWSRRLRHERRTLSVL